MVSVATSFCLLGVVRLAFVRVACVWLGLPIRFVPARYRARYRTRGRLGIGAEYARGVSLAVRRMRLQPPRWYRCPSDA